ncbi:SHOCT domain-containing protein [Halorussus salilacus]|uniref:SHOCT domain-containing protein n=1 Tax=Halorussus salilacus TaxID=2953750 RepID=UPI00209F0E85|nr:SHOCT domain-containing protein [Halorussus salilacus]USZ68715.1 SHOCT domain-containing protein [Halorussus salilacus]
MGDTLAETPDEENALVKATALAVLGAGLLALFLGYSWFWMVFALGFAVVVPLVKVATKSLGDADRTGEVGRERRPEPAGPRSDSRGESDRGPASRRDALDSLRDRYARGELGDEEFERKVERLLETETLEDARGHVRRGREAGPRESESAEREHDSERGRSSAEGPERERE